MNNDRGFFERQHHDLDWCGHRNYGSGTWPWQVWLLLGIFTLWGLWVVLILLLPHMQQAKRHRQQRTRQLHAEGIQTRSF